MDLNFTLETPSFWTTGGKAPITAANRTHVDVRDGLYTLVSGLSMARKTTEDPSYRKGKSEVQMKLPTGVHSYKGGDLYVSGSDLSTAQKNHRSLDSASLQHTFLTMLSIKLVTCSQISRYMH